MPFFFSTSPPPSPRSPGIGREIFTGAAMCRDLIPVIHTMHISGNNSHDFNLKFIIKNFFSRFFGGFGDLFICMCIRTRVYTCISFRIGFLEMWNNVLLTWLRVREKLKLVSLCMLWNVVYFIFANFVRFYSILFRLFVRLFHSFVHSSIFHKPNPDLWRIENNNWMKYIVRRCPILLTIFNVL